MAKDLPPGRFRFCKTRSLVPLSGKRGQVTTCLAAKSAWHVGVWQEWPDERRESCTQFIKSFQESNGSFVDHWLLRRIGWTTRVRQLRGGRLVQALSSLRDEKTRAVRAETRQSAATLLLLGDSPQHSLPIISHSQSSVREFIRSLDWARPWGAGSHASHLISFIEMNRRLSAHHSLGSELLDLAFEETDRYLHPTSGFWGIGNVVAVQGINGAMKMLTAYQWTERTIPYPERLIDYALGHMSGQDGCGVLDRLYVLHRASMDAPGYRSRELERFALLAVDEIARYHQGDGGFSFFPNRAQRTYYGALVSLGGRQSDMHGTVMLTWALSIALDMLGIRQECGWQMSSP